MRKILFIISTIVLSVGSIMVNAEDKLSDTEKSAHMAHQNFVDAINSNNLDSLLGMLTEDVVFMGPNAPAIVGKKAVAPWVFGYYKAFKTNWNEQVQEFIVSGEWAFERHTFLSIDTSLTDGQVIEGTGWGLIIYHYDADGKWRVARDAWGSDTE